MLNLVHNILRILFGADFLVKDLNDVRRREIARAFLSVEGAWLRHLVVVERDFGPVRHIGWVCIPCLPEVLELVQVLEEHQV